VAVDQQIVAVGGAVGVDEGNAAEAVLPLKIRVQIFFRIGGGVHHRVVDDGAVDAQPAKQIVVLLIQGGVFRQHHRLRRLRLRGDGGFRGRPGGPGLLRRGLHGGSGGRGVFLHHFGEFAEITAGFAHMDQDGSHRDQRDAEHCHEDDEKGIGASSSPSALPGVIAAGRDGGAGCLEFALPVCHVSSLSIWDAPGHPPEKGGDGISATALVQQFTLFS